MIDRILFTLIVAGAVTVVFPLQASAQAMTAAPAGARVRITAPADGSTVSSPVMVIMGAEGIQVTPAGELKEGTGHHHLVINDSAPEYGQVVPKDATHLHFGKGQTEAKLELAPGKYTITAQLADGIHRSYGADLSYTITIHVE